MITERIQNLFHFIDFLYSNIDNFKQYDEVINELILLDKEQDKLSPRKNFADKLKYDEVQAEIKLKFNVIDENVIQIIKSKVTELNICDWNAITNLGNYNISEISKLKENFSKDDIPEILQYKSKYLEFRIKTNCDYFQTFFFLDLDKILKVLFDFFKETTENEFETFETKNIQVNDIREALELSQQGYKKFTLPIAFLNPSKVQQNNKALPPQQTETKTEQETPKNFEDLFYKPEHAEPCLEILRELQPPVIDAINNYIGKAKGVFPLWVKVLKNHKPEPLIKQFKDTVYKDLLNKKVKGLNLTKDASEFRKQYARLEKNKIELDIKAILSQYSQSGKLGK